MPNKSFPVSRVFTHRRQQHPRPVQAVLCAAGGNKHHHGRWRPWEAKMLLQPSTPGKHLHLLPASCEVPPQGSSWMAAVGQGMGSRRAHRGWCHHPHGPWPWTRNPGPLGKHKPALQCDPNSVTHIQAPLERASLQGNLMFKGSKETPENCTESTSSFPDLLL